jgi:hypothetical protein
LIFFLAGLRKRFNIDINTAINNAVPKLPMINPSPIILLVSNSISAFTTNKNNPSVRIVAGNVNNIKIGRTSILIIASTILARIAIPMLSTIKLGINQERNRNNSALTRIPPNHFIKNTTFDIYSDRNSVSLNITEV